MSTVFQAMTRCLRAPNLLFTGLFILLTLTLLLQMMVSGFVIGSDGLGYYAPLRSILIDGDLQYGNEFMDFNPFGHAVPDPYRLTETGHVPNPYSVGPALLWAPFFLFAHGLTMVLAAFGVALAPDGYSALYQLAIGFGSVAYGMAGLALIYTMLLRFFQRNEALVATGLIALATNVFYYLAVQPVMSHAMSLFAVTLFVFVWLTTMGRRSLWELVLLGLVAGLMVLVRPQNALFLSLLALEWLGFYKTESGYLAHWRRYIVDALIFSLIFIVALLPQAIVWKVVYGQFMVDAYDGAGFDFTNPYILESLFSARHGLISWTPVILLALIGLLLFVRDNIKLGVALLIAFTLQVYVNSSWADYWWFGESFGSRAYINCSFIFAVGLAQLLSFLRGFGIALYPVLAALVVWNLLFIAQFTLGLVSRTESVDFVQVLSNHVEIPKMVFRAILARF